MSSPTPAHSEAELSADERQRLVAAHRKLREAVAAYEPFLGGELKPGEPEEVPNPEDAARRQEAAGQAQAAIEEAEQELWRLREKLLGWPRPAWAADAALVADWFSEEDRVYDEMDPSSGQ